MGLFSGIGYLFEVTGSAIINICGIVTGPVVRLVIGKNRRKFTSSWRKRPDNPLFGIKLPETVLLSNEHTLALSPKSSNVNSSTNVCNSIKSSEESTPKTAKIRLLEEELSKLKTDLTGIFGNTNSESDNPNLTNSIMEHQDLSTFAKPNKLSTNGNSNLPDCDHGLNVSAALQLTTVVPPPPPPPPPPPAAIPTGTNSPFSMKKKGSSNKESATPAHSSSVKEISLSEILNKSSSLRKTERSPGGTPLRPRNAKTSEKHPSTNQDIITQALKRKFQNVQQSPDGSPKPETPKGTPKGDWDQENYQLNQDAAQPTTPFIKQSIRT